MLYQSERLSYRYITMQDLEDMYDLDSNPLVHKYLGKKPVSTRAQSEAIIKDLIQQYETYNLGRVAVIRKSDNAFLGWSGLKYETVLREEFNYYDIGYRLKEAHWGQGYATESAVASLKYGFEQLQFEKIGGAAEIEHVVSNHILQKIGLKKGEQFVFDNTECNWYELSKEEYRG